MWVYNYVARANDYKYLSGIGNSLFKTFVL
jgi:hypothetical protein